MSLECVNKFIIGNGMIACAAVTIHNKLLIGVYRFFLWTLEIGIGR